MEQTKKRLGLAILNTVDDSDRYINAWANALTSKRRMTGRNIRFIQICLYLRVRHLRSGELSMLSLFSSSLINGIHLSSRIRTLLWWKRSVYGFLSHQWPTRYGLSRGIGHW